MGKWIFMKLSISCLTLLVIFGCKSIDTRSKRGSETMSYKAHVDVSGEDVLPHCHEHLKAANELKNQLVGLKEDEPFLSTLHLYNDILVHVDAAMSKASLLSQVHPNADVRKNAEISEQKISSFITDLSLDK